MIDTLPTAELIDVRECSACGADHVDREAVEDDQGLHYICNGRRVDVERLTAPAQPTDEQPDEMEAHRLRMQALMQEAIAPLLERLDVTERNAAEYQAQANERDVERLAEARARFKASLITQLVAGQLAANTFNWNNNLRLELEDACALTDLILDAARVTR